jgi:MATE family multidrug resistance protein
MSSARRPSLTVDELTTESLIEAKQAARKGLASELWLFLELAVPTTLLNLGFVISPLLTASYVGRKFGPTFLSGFTLASLTGNLCTFSLMAGLFSAADTLGPQSFGTGDKREVGLIAIRGFVFACCILLPINVVLVLYLKDILVALGQNQDAATHASDWYRIFVWSLPFCVAYNSIWKFLSAQHIMRPMIYVSLLSCGVILPLGLELLTEAHGFLGSAMAYVTFQASQALLLIIYLCWKKPYVEGTWPGLGCWREAVLRQNAMIEFMHLAVGGMFAQSEWVFWEALGLVIGLLGVVPLSVHTIPNQVTMLLCLAPFSAGTALTIRMGATLPISVRDAQNIAIACVVLVTVFSMFLNLLVYVKSESVIGFFTNDREVIELANAVWWKVCIFNQCVALFEILCGVANGLGIQWTLGGVNFFWLWVFGLPAIYHFAVTRGGGLEAAWTWINYPYVGMHVCLIAAFIKESWRDVADNINDKEEIDPSMDLLPELQQNGNTNHEHAGLLNDAFLSDYGSSRV